MAGTGGDIPPRSREDAIRRLKRVFDELGSGMSDAEMVVTALVELGIIKFNPPAPNQQNPAAPKAAPTAEGLRRMVRDLPSDCFSGSSSRRVLADRLISFWGAVESPPPKPPLLMLDACEAVLPTPDSPTTLVVSRPYIIAQLKAQGYIVVQQAGIQNAILELINSDVVYMREPGALAEDIVRLLGGEAVQAPPAGNRRS